MGPTVAGFLVCSRLWVIITDPSVLWGPDALIVIDPSVLWGPDALIVIDPSVLWGPDAYDHVVSWYCGAQVPCQLQSLDILRSAQWSADMRGARLWRWVLRSANVALVAIRRSLGAYLNVSMLFIFVDDDRLARVMIDFEFDCCWSLFCWALLFAVFCKRKDVVILLLEYDLPESGFERELSFVIWARMSACLHHVNAMLMLRWSECPIVWTNWC